MKKLIVITVILVSTMSFIFASNSNEYSGSKTTESDGLGASLTPDDLNAAGAITQLNMPWARTGFVVSELVISKGDYCLWRVQSKNLVTIPSCEPVGSRYHYFVFKNGSFLFTVNNCNKDKVYEFFSE